MVLTLTRVYINSEDQIHFGKCDTGIFFVTGSDARAEQQKKKHQNKTKTTAKMLSAAREWTSMDDGFVAGTGMMGCTR